jgi:hypothetical protein
MIRLPSLLSMKRLAVVNDTRWRPTVPTLVFRSHRPRKAHVRNDDYMLRYPTINVRAIRAVSGRREAWEGRVFDHEGFFFCSKYPCFKRIARM